MSSSNGTEIVALPWSDVSSDLAARKSSASSLHYSLETRKFSEEVKP